MITGQALDTMIDVSANGCTNGASTADCIGCELATVRAASRPELRDRDQSVGSASVQVSEISCFFGEYY